MHGCASAPADIRSCAGLRRAHIRRLRPFLPSPRAARPVFPELSCSFPFSFSGSAPRRTQETSALHAAQSTQCFLLFMIAPGAQNAKKKRGIFPQKRACTSNLSTSAGACLRCTKAGKPFYPACTAQDSRTRSKSQAAPPPATPRAWATRPPGRPRLSG